MDPNNRRTYTNIALFSVFVILVSVLAIYNAFGGFAPEETGADDSAGEFVYNHTDFRFAPTGEVLGVDLYNADSAEEPYTVDGFKTLNSLKFTIANVPVGGVAEFCVSKKSNDTQVVTPLICDRQNLEASSNSAWELEFPFGVLVQPDNEYYCDISVDATRQEKLPSERYTSMTANCELVFDSLDSKETVVTVLPANPFSSWQIADPQLLPDLSYTASTELQLSGLYVAIAADNSLPEQKFVDICFETELAQEICLQPFNFRSGVDGRYNQALLTEELTIEQGTDFSFSCRTQVGRQGGCDLFAYLQIPDEQLAALGNEPLNKRDFYDIDSSTVEEYCNNNVLLYSNQPSYIGIEGEQRRVERCQAILTSNDY
jgi:hypothetical protein